jgi:elongation factor G
MRSKGAPVLSISVRPKTPDDARRLAQGLDQLKAEDGNITVRPDPLTGEVVIGGMGEQHLEIVIDRLKREFDVEAGVGRPQVAYKEVLTRSADGEMKFVNRAAGRAQYAHVKLRLIRERPGTGYAFVDGISGGAIPAEFIESVDEGIRDALAQGVLAGHPIDGVRVHLLDGSYHDVDSTKEAFRTAGFLAAVEAARKAAPVLFEPVMLVEVSVPEEHVEEVVADLRSRRGRFQSMEDRDGTSVVLASVPLAELLGYATDLRERTMGRGSVSMRFERYQPRHLSGEDDGGRDSLVGAPLTPHTKPRVSGIGLPEPDADWDDDLDAGRQPF